MASFSSEQLDFLIAILDKMHRSSRHELGILIPNLGEYEYSEGRDKKEFLEEGIYSSLSDLYAHASGLHVPEATIKLASHFGHSPEFCFHDDFAIEGKELCLSQEDLRADISNEIPKAFYCKPNSYTCFHIHKFSAPNGRVGGYLTLYSLNNTKFIAAAFFTKVAAGDFYNPTSCCIRLGITDSHRRLTGEDGNPPRKK